MTESGRDTGMRPYQFEPLRVIVVTIYMQDLMPVMKRKTDIRVATAKLHATIWEDGLVYTHNEYRCCRELQLSSV